MGRYTLEQACRALAATGHAYGGKDMKDAVNRAIEDLSAMSGWECLRRVVRFSSAGPCFTLPQDLAGLVRVCVNGHPAALRGRDFRFLQSGPGDMERPGPGFSGPVNVEDVGYRPVMVDPGVPFKVFAYADATGEPYVTVRGVDPSGREVTARVEMTAAPVYDQSTGAKTSGVEVDDAEPNDTVFQEITEVVLDECASKYVTLYAAEVQTDKRYAIAMYHPSVKVPMFRQYQIPGIREGQPVELLVEARIEPLPLVRPTDVVPFPTLRPIEWLIMAEWKSRAGEESAAEKNRQQAVQWMAALESAHSTVQTRIQVNSVFDMSPGSITADAWNI